MKTKNEKKLHPKSKENKNDRIIEKSKDVGKTIYIGNLNYRRDEEGIKSLFSEFGKVKSVEIVTNPDTDKKLGYAFVRMYRTSEALVAIKKLNGKIVDGRTLKVSEAKDRFAQKKSPTDIPLIKKEVATKSPPNKRKRKVSGLQKLLNYLNTPSSNKTKK